MSLISTSRQSCYCAFCKSPRKVYTKKRIGLVDILASALGSLVVMAVLYREFDPQVFLIFVGFIAVSETFVQLRWRISMTCQHCGFDPILYLKDVGAAVAKVQARLDQRKSDPAALLMRQLNLPTRKMENKKIAKSPMSAPATQSLKVKGKGRLVSRQI